MTITFRKNQIRPHQMIPDFLHAISISIVAGITLYDTLSFRYEPSDGSTFMTVEYNNEMEASETGAAIYASLLGLLQPRGFEYVSSIS